MNGHLPVLEILRADGPVGLLIGGSGVNTARVFPGDAPQKALWPLVTVEVFDGEPFDSKDGASTLEHDMVKVSTYATTDAAAYDLAAKCRTALEGKSGTYNGYYIEGIRFLRPDSFHLKLTNRIARVYEYDYEVRIRI